MWKTLPGESTFLRAFAEFTNASLAERTHSALVQETLGDRIVGHISVVVVQAIEAREKLAKKVDCQKHNRPRRRDVAVPVGKLEQQQGKSLTQLMRELPRDFNRAA